MPGLAHDIPRIFLSHSHHDAEFCHSFVASLRSRLNLADPDHIFYDETSLQSGEQWLQRIQYEVLARPIFMVILTPQAVAAKYVQQETHLALRETIEHGGRTLIPILAAPCNPNDLAPLLANFQMVDFVHRPYQVAFDGLVTVLQAGIGGPASADIVALPEILDAPQWPTLAPNPVTDGAAEKSAETQESPQRSYFDLAMEQLRRTISGGE